MTTYSNSRVSTYENCPYQYKLKYIDRIKVDVPTTIEAFMSLLGTVTNGGALSDLGRQLPHLDNEKRMKTMKRSLIVK